MCYCTLWQCAFCIIPINSELTTARLPCFPEDRSEGIWAEGNRVSPSWRITLVVPLFLEKSQINKEIDEGSFVLCNFNN